MPTNACIAIRDAEFYKLKNPKIGTEFELNDHRGVIVGVARVASSALFGVPTLYTTYNRALQYIPNTRFTMDVPGRSVARSRSPCSRAARSGTGARRRSTAISRLWRSIARWSGGICSGRGHAARARARRAALKAQDEALRTATEALRLVQINYQAGLKGYLDVLAANALYHQARINELQATAVRYQDTAALYVALGGGWWSQREALNPSSYPSISGNAAAVTPATRR